MQRSVFVFASLAASCALFLGGERTPSGVPETGDVARGRGIRYSAKGKWIELDGAVQIRRGIVEYLASQKGGEKEHESVLLLDARPRDIQFALILLGLRQGLPGQGPRVQGDPTPPTGDPVAVVARWIEPRLAVRRGGRDIALPVYPEVERALGPAAAQGFSVKVRQGDRQEDLFRAVSEGSRIPLAPAESVQVLFRRDGQPASRSLSGLLLEPGEEGSITGAAAEVRGDELLKRHPGGQALPRFDFVFSGSRFEPNPRTGENVFLAEAEGGTIIATYHDPAAILDNPLRAEGGNDEAIAANEEHLPVQGTPVVLTLRPAAPAPPAPEGGGK